ncbi:MAG: AmmeMemoRadiSam system protein B [archaeon]
MREQKTTRNALYAGSFYPSGKKALSEMIGGFLKNSEQKKINGKLRALVVPHAGYVYSGQVAAFAFSALKKAKPKRIVLFGPSHHDFVEGANSFEGKWVTPLGSISVSKNDLPVIKNDQEHCLEVQVPFLQKVLKKFAFTPIIYGEISAKKLGEIIEKFSEKETVFIASSDLSHYLSYDLAKKSDSESIDSVLKLDLNTFIESGDACGKTGIAVLIILAKKYGWKPLLLEYKNSGDTSGNKNNVVGYASIAFIDKEGK